MPLNVHYFFADGLIYPLMYYVVRYRRKMVRKNLRLSFPEKSEGERQAIAKAECAELRKLMDAEDVRIWKAIVAKVVVGDSVKKIAQDLGVSEPRVYQLIARAKEIGKEYRGH